MKHGSNSRRSRSGRNSGRRSNNIRTKVFDSNGPDVRIRGNAMQVHEKYVALARDASAAGDHVLAESYLQHAEHYQRLLNEINPPKPQMPKLDVDTNKKATDNVNTNTKENKVMQKQPEIA